jgi:hypothetical protein
MKVSMLITIHVFHDINARVDDAEQHHLTELVMARVNNEACKLIAEQRGNKGAISCTFPILHIALDFPGKSLKSSELRIWRRLKYYRNPHMVFLPSDSGLKNAEMSSSPKVHCDVMVLRITIGGQRKISQRRESI